MTRRRIFLWMGLGVFFVTLILCGTVLAKETYQVQQGDTISAIAAKTGATPGALKAANNLKGSRIKANQFLVIPAPEDRTASKSKASPLREAESTVESAKSEPTREAQEAADIGLTPEGTFAENGKRTQDNGAHRDSGKWCNPDEPKLLVKAAMGFLGAPYRMGGFSVNGIDCSGLVKKIYQFFDIDLPRTAIEQSRIGMRVARSELAEGDLLFFNTRKPPIGHVGIYIGNNQFIHALSRNKGVRVDNLNKPYYNKRFIRAVRLMERDDL
jgi:peptidoglycan endopeptidase LytE